MIECVYFNDYIRCYRDGSVERKLIRKQKGYEIGDWKKCELAPNKTTGYFEIHTIERKLIRVHRVIAYCFGILEQMENIKDVNNVDHINGVRTDNRVENLRQVTHQQNNWNQLNTKGYYWHKQWKTWKVRIMVNGKRLFLGNYDTEAEARAAYLRAKEIHHVI